MQNYYYRPETNKLIVSGEDLLKSVEATYFLLGPAVSQTRDEAIGLLTKRWSWPEADAERTVQMSGLSREVVEIKEPQLPETLADGTDMMARMEDLKEKMLEREKGTCPKCGKELTITTTGKFYKHKCVAPEEEQPKQEPEPKEEKKEDPLQKVKVNPDQVIAAYVETRDKIAELERLHKEEVAKHKAFQEAREKWLLGQLDGEGLESMRSAQGTVFVVWKDSATVSSRDSFLEWVGDDFETRNQFLNSAVNKTAVKQMIEDTEGEVPPGVNYVKIKNVQVRRA